MARPPRYSRHRALLLWLLAVLLSSTSGCASGLGRAEPAALADIPNVAWRFYGSEQIYATMLTNDTVYVNEALRVSDFEIPTCNLRLDGKNDHTTGNLFALDRTTGAQRWTFGSYQPRDVVTHGDVVYQIGADAQCQYHLFALDAHTGAVRWQTATHGDYNHMLVSDQLIFCRDADSLVIFNASDGTRRATVKTGRWSTSSFMAGPQRAGATIVIMNDQLQVVAFDSTSGAEVWRVALPAGEQPTLAGDAHWVYVQQHDGLLRLDAQTGARQAALLAGTFVSSDATHIYLSPPNQDGVLALNPQTGAQAWAFHTAEACCFRTASLDSTNLLGSGAKSLYALDLATGKVQWSFALNDYIGHLVQANGVVYVESRESRFNGLFVTVRALNAANGQLLWHTTPVQVNYQDFIVGSDGMYIIQNGRLLVVRAAKDASPKS